MVLRRINGFSEEIVTEQKGFKTLLEVPTNKKVKIVNIVGGRGARKQLAQFGIGIGSVIKVKRNAPFAGPLLIENQGMAVALGRGVAAKILVEEL